MADIAGAVTQIANAAASITTSASKVATVAQDGETQAATGAGAQARTPAPVTGEEFAAFMGQETVTPEQVQAFLQRPMTAKQREQVQGLLPPPQPAATPGEQAVENNEASREARVGLDQLSRNGQG